MLAVAVALALYAWLRGVTDLGGIPGWLVWFLIVQLLIALVISVITGLWLGALALTILLGTLFRVYF